MASTEHPIDLELVGFISVPTRLAEKVLAEGYRPVRRTRVPYAETREAGLRAMMQYHPQERDALLIEVRRTASDGSVLPAERIERRELDNGATCTSILPDPVSKLLEAKFLSLGIVSFRGLTDYAEAPCPICGASLAGKESERGQVGRARYINGAFMVTPCQQAGCLQRQQERQERLNGTTARLLYHACSPGTLREIRKCSGKMLRGTRGAAGSAMYFAHTARETEWKAECGEPRVVLKCRVRMGREFQGGRWQTEMTFGQLIQGGHDSLILDRGGTGFPVPDAPVKGTRLEDLKGEKRHPGYEFVVYSWDQVEVLGEVERDPVPAS